MSNAKHTPGPWMTPHFARDDVKCICASVLAEAYYGAVAEVFIGDGKLLSEGGNDCPLEDEAKANAYLIAAAPELLAVLTSMNHMGGDERGGYCICPLNDGSAPDHRHATVCADARQAIAKATGVSQ